MAADTARCCACGDTKPIGEFYADRSKASGRMARCRACDVEKCRRYYAENLERVLARYQSAPPREAVCRNCREVFVATNGRQRYCRPGCRPQGDRGAKVEEICDCGGRESVARARDRARGGGRYCSKSCGLKDRSRPAWKLVRP